MRTVESARAAAARWEVATPQRPGRLPGVGMAGFRDRSAEPLDLPVVPYPSVMIAFEFGEGLLVEGEDGRRQRGSTVLGLAPGGLRVRGSGIECLQIRLSPVVAHAVLGVLPSAGSGRLPSAGGAMVALEDLWGAGARRVEERLRAAGSWQERFAIADAELLRRYVAGRSATPEVAHTWRELTAHRGQIRIDALAAEVGWSRQRLWSRFRAEIGLTPKRAAQLVRFDHAAHRLAAGHSAGAVAAESGYADQSHLHRDALAFAGMTPTAVAAAPWLAVDDTAWAAGDTTRSGVDAARVTDGAARTVDRTVRAVAAGRRGSASMPG
ncbi:helix-turn-helix domain-containing protein [Streptomyces indicus]|uniref:AraC-type DNA-binding protein n=1 Tax=Streptomyces indicus TaxID=417292 RepID=A0A1G8YM20_9ACTN|nr:helix-turn-helix domain-containing protein [Streptomyces indicus]SDK03185.1 AraC-type DNA-binding protein [Streptomyces indicus]